MSSISVGRAQSVDAFSLQDAPSTGVSPAGADRSNVWNGAVNGDTVSSTSTRAKNEEKGGRRMPMMPKTTIKISTVRNFAGSRFCSENRGARQWRLLASRDTSDVCVAFYRHGYRNVHISKRVIRRRADAASPGALKAFKNVATKYSLFKNVVSRVRSA